MLRAVFVIKAAFIAFAPGFEARTEGAELLRELGHKHGVDPFTVFSVVWGESRWNPTAFNPKSGARGLGQILPENFPACRDDLNGWECSRVVSRLDDWRSNLVITAGMMSGWREYCSKRVGTRLAVHWLQGYGGYDSVRGTTCGHKLHGKRWVPLPIPAKVVKVLSMRRELARRFG